MTSFNTKTNRHKHSASVRANEQMVRVFRRLGQMEHVAERLRRVHLACGNASHAYDYGHLLSRLGRLEEADSVLAICSQAEAAPAEWYYRHAIVLERLKRYEPALDLLVKAIEADPQLGEYRYRAGVCLAALGRHEGAFQQFEAAIDFNQMDPRAAKRLTASLAQSLPLWRRLAVIEKALVTAPAEAGLLFAHARSAYWMGDYTKAIRSYRKVGSLEHLGPEDAYRLANALEATESDASSAFTKATRPSEVAPVRRLGLGALHETHKEPQRALTTYLAEWENGQQSAERAFRIGMVHERLYQWNQAHSWYRISIGMEAHYAYRHYKLALSSERIGLYEEAVDHYLIAADLDQQKGRYWIYRAGSCLVELGQHDDARKLLIQSYGGSLKNTFLEAIRASSTGNYSGTSITDNSYPLRRKISQTNTEIIAAAGRRYFDSLDLEHAAAEYEWLFRRVELRESKTIIEAAISMAAAGNTETASDVLLSGRDFRNPDGLNMKVLTRGTQERRASLYAEYTENLPVDEKTILYESYWGSNLSCHPLAIFKRARKSPHFMNFVHVWVVQKSADIPDELAQDNSVVFVKYGTDKYLRYLATSKYLINNTTFVPFFTRRPNQRYLNTWHGTPLKTLGRSVNGEITEHANVTRNLLQATHIIAPNEHTRHVLLNDFDIAGVSKAPVKILGSPRLDELVLSGNSEYVAVRNLLGIVPGDSRRVVLYAPTWRGSNDSRVLDLIELEADLAALDSVEGYVVLFRGHHLTEGQLAGTELDSRIVPRDIDTYTLLKAVDVLVTDYSSLLFDFLVTGRRVITYAPDEEKYASERGLYFPPSSVVTEVARNREQLCNLIAGSNDHRTDQRYELSKQQYAPMEDGLSSQRALDFLVSDDEYDKYTGTKPIVGFFASLLPNGITSALRDLINAIPVSEIRVVLFVDASVPDKSHIEKFVRELRRPVQVVSRHGSPVFTLVERQAHSDLKRWRKISSGEHRSILNRGFAREMRRLVGDASITSLMQFEGYASYWTALFANANIVNVSSSIYLHNEMENEVKHKYPYLVEIFQWLNDYDHVASVSKPVAEANERYLKESGLLDTDREVFWLRNVIDIDRVAEMSMRLPEEAISSGQPLVVAAGRLSVEKNHTLLISLMPKLLSTAPQARLVILGDGPLRTALEAQIDGLGLRGRVELKGHVSNPYPYIQQADVFALPSLHEGQPVVLYEAIALGTPFVAAPTPGTREVATSVGTEVIAPNVDDFAAAILDIVSNSGAERVDFTVLNSEAIARFLQLFNKSEGR